MTAERIIIETLLRIPDKEGRDCDFVLNEEQSELDTNLALRNLVPKARQRGISAYAVALFTTRCLAYHNRRAFILSHTGEATTRLLDRAHYYLKNLRCDQKPELSYSNRNEIIFSKTNSTLYIGTANAATSGVGDTITDFHGSEVALWKNPQELLKGVFNSVPRTGTIILESTGNGQGNYYHRACMRAAGGIGPYRLHFFSWLRAPEYRIKLTEDEARDLLDHLDDELDELKYKDILDAEQFAWRRDKLSEMDYDLKSFTEQFPVTLDECFQGSGASYFQKIAYEPTTQWHKDDRWAHFYVLGDHPRVGLHYVAGLDVGGGTGRDSSVMELFCVETMEQVGEWSWNRMEPHIFAEAVVPILEEFNDAYVNCERNNHGILTLDRLIKLYPNNAIHMSRPSESEIKEFGRIADFGTYVTSKNRLGVIGALRKWAAKELVLHSPLLKDELNSFIEKDNGKIEAQEGCHDDKVMAGAHAAYVLAKQLTSLGLRKAETEQQRNRDPFSLDYILDELEQRYREEYGT